MGVYNAITNAKFWEVSASQVLTLAVAILIAFWAAQRKTDERRTKDQVEQIVRKIQDVVSTTGFTVFDASANPEEVQKRITMSTRKLTNSIDILRKYSEASSLSIDSEIKYIEEQVTGYRNFVSVKVGDLDYLSKSETHLRLYADNINNKCDYIILNLHTK